MRRHVFWIMLAVMIGGHTAVASAGGESVIEPDTDLYWDVGPAVEAWLDALVARDVAGLLAFALPEDLESTRAALADPESNGYRVLLSDESEVRNLAANPRSALMLFQERTPYDPAFGVTACQYDPLVLDPGTGTERLRLLEMPFGDALACHYFFFADGRWRADYESPILGKDDDGP
jgi:hypothetical protein